MNKICRLCGSKEDQVLLDARPLGLLAEFQAGVYSCCQIVAWADEQWLAWSEAAEQDGKLAELVTKPLEEEDNQSLLVPVPVRLKARKQKNP